MLKHPGFTTGQPSPIIDKPFSPGKLSNQDLFTFLIGPQSPSGLTKRQIKDLLKEIGSFDRLYRIPLGRLASIAGIGIQKAIVIKAAVELGQRQLYKTIDSSISLQHSKNLYDCYAHRLAPLTTKIFIGVMVDTRLHWMGDMELSKGARCESIMKPREVLASMQPEYPSGVMFVHNHPSGDPTPSASDRTLTKQLSQTGSSLGVPVLDHLIIGDDSYYSFADSGSFGLSSIPITPQVVLQGQPSQSQHDPLTDLFPDVWCLHDFDLDQKQEDPE